MGVCKQGPVGKKIVSIQWSVGRQKVKKAKARKPMLAPDYRLLATRFALHLCLFFFPLVFCGLPFFAYGGTVREVELIDGSILRAEVLSMDGKTYRLRSDSLGTIEVPEYRVKAVRSPRESTESSAHSQPAPDPTFIPTAPAATPAPLLAPNELQQTLSQNPAAMSKIIALQNDPLMQQVLEDENTMRAVQAGALGALMNDPKIRALMNHPTIRELNGQYGQ